MAEGRTWVIELPPGTPVLTANDRMHRYATNTVIANLKNVISRLATQRRIPQLERAQVTLEYESPPRYRKDRHPLASKRVEDGDALFPTRKACVDGLVYAGVFPKGDSKLRVVGDATCRLLPYTHPRGLVRIIITEVTANGLPDGHNASTGG